MGSCMEFYYCQLQECSRLEHLLYFVFVNVSVCVCVCVCVLCVCNSYCQCVVRAMNIQPPMLVHVYEISMYSTPQSTQHREKKQLAGQIVQLLRNYMYMYIHVYVRTVCTCLDKVFALCRGVISRLQDCLQCY